MVTADDLRARAQRVVAEATGLQPSRTDAAELDRAVRDAAEATGAPDVAAYVATLEQRPTDDPAWAPLIARLTVSETYFFRDATFAALEATVLPALIERREREGARRLRLWSAGCATGEEPYSLAMLVERLLVDRPGWSVSILGTDVDVEALGVARAGEFREWSLRTTPPWARACCFRKRGDGTFELTRGIREMVTFAPLNLVGPGAAFPAAMDLILCRNVLMYLTERARTSVAGRLAAALRDGGLLGVTAVESFPDLFGGLEPIGCDGITFFRRPAAGESQADVRSPSPLPARRARPRRAAGLHAPPPRTPEAERADVLLGRARDEAGRGNLGRARDLCADTELRGRLDFEAQLLLAAIHEEIGDVRSARLAARRAVSLAPQLPAAHFVLGGLLIRDGDMRAGRRSLRDAVALLDELPPSQTVRGTDGLAAGQLRGLATSMLEHA